MRKPEEGTSGFQEELRRYPEAKKTDRFILLCLPAICKFGDISCFAIS